MEALFLESRAARQIKRYAANKDVEDAPLLQNLLSAAYKNGRAFFEHRKSLGVLAFQGLSYEDWWVKRCLNNDDHKGIDINELMCWGDTPEGEALWFAVHRAGVGEE